MSSALLQCLQLARGPAEACVPAPWPDSECWQRKLRAGLGSVSSDSLVDVSLCSGMEDLADGPISKHQTGCVSLLCRVHVNMSSSFKEACRCVPKTLQLSKVLCSGGRPPATDALQTCPPLLLCQAAGGCRLRRREGCMSDAGGSPLQGRPVSMMLKSSHHFGYCWHILWPLCDCSVSMHC